MPVKEKEVTEIKEVTVDVKVTKEFKKWLSEKKEITTMVVKDDTFIKLPAKQHVNGKFQDVLLKVEDFPKKMMLGYLLEYAEANAQTKAQNT